MDQDSFRKLLQTPSSSSAASTAPRTSAASARGKKPKPKNADPAQPAFKPRTVRKLDQYRDRAGERRQGRAHDYAQVEALAEDFEKRNADKDPETLEEQRKYLGGDSEHTVLVKGLDFALLEQNKARLATESTVEDDVLEQAFAEGSSQAPKKRSRADILSALKNKRQKGDEPPDAAVPDAPLDDAKKTGKFKPIGFKPIGGDKPKKKKAKDGDADGAPKKKKKKLADGTSDPVQPTPRPPAHTPVPSDPAPAPATSTTSATPAGTRAPPPEPAPMDEDDDIFAGAGDYAGIELGDDDEDGDVSDAGDAGARAARDDEDGEIPDAAPRRWVDIDDGPVLPPKSASPPPAEGASPARMQEDEEPERAQEEEQPARLQPLASSAVPSIRELLAMDEAQEREAKRRARREKKGKKAAGDESE